MRLLLALLFGVAVITGCGGGSSPGRSVDAPPATNNDGSTVTGVLTPLFSASTGDIPLPNVLVLGFDDLTLNLPVDDPTNVSDPFVALNAIDGWSTTERWIVNFVEEEDGIRAPRRPGTPDPDTVTPGGTVRFFEISLDPSTGAVTGVNREMTPGVEYVAVVSGSTLAIIPLRPLKELTAYMAVLTNGIKDMDGNDSSPDAQYFLAKQTAPLVDANGNSTVTALDNASARALEPLRQVTQTHLLAAASQGIDPDDITVTWVATTQSITPVTKTVRSLVQPAPTTVGPTPFDTSAVGGFGLANISVGVITLPYYAGIPSAENPTAPLNSFWTAAPGAYVAPFDGLGLDPTSTNLTAYNPIPVLTGMQTVPLIVTTPSPASGLTKPPGGWPVVIFGHGITRNRTDALAIADTMASIGYAVVAMDLPLHGVNPDDEPMLAPFYIEGTPFGPIANERTFDLDILNNATVSQGPDGLIDPSGLNLFIGGLASLLTGRDSVRQGQVDFSVLAASIPFMDIDGDALPDFDGSNIGFVGISWGSLTGIPFAAIEPTVNRFFLSVPPGGIARMAAASPAFSPLVNGILSAGAGVEPGTANYELFLLAWQTISDPADPVNWIAEAAEFNAIMLHEVIDDTTVPNFVATAPLSGTEPLIALGGLSAYSASRSDPAGLRVAGRFLPPATHGSLLTPAAGSPAATAEMQAQMASFIATFGTSVLVTDPSVMVPE